MPTNAVHHPINIDLNKNIYSSNFALDKVGEGTIIVHLKITNLYVYDTLNKIAHI